MNPEDDLIDPVPPLVEAAPAEAPKQKRKIRVVDQSQSITNAQIGQPRRVKAKMSPADNKPPEGSLLTEEEIKAIREEARKEALEELRAGERKKAKAKALQEARIKLSPQSEEEIVGFILEMPSYAHQWPMMIDGKVYFHGNYYEVPLSLYDVFAEQMYRAYEHQRVIDGKSIAEDARRQYRELHSGATLSGKKIAA